MLIQHAPRNDVKHRTLETERAKLTQTPRPLKPRSFRLVLPLFYLELAHQHCVQAIALNQ